MCITEKCIKNEKESYYNQFPFLTLFPYNETVIIVFVVLLMLKFQILVVVEHAYCNY